jgi:lysyl-tRNA synthetase class 2
MPTADWRPAAGVETARQRAAMLAAARKFFDERSILEVDTPAMSRATASDPHIDSNRAQLDLTPGEDHYLRTSPEFAMKRLLCAGYPDIYEIARVFRDGEVGVRHQPEFTLVEWYRHGFSLQDMMGETIEFLERLLESEHLAQPATYPDYRDAFRECSGIDPMTAGLPALQDASGTDARLVVTLGARRDDWLDLLLATRVAPTFARDRLTVLHHYPASQAALARLSPSDPSVAERFEVFHGSLELANGFVELADAGEQAARFERDQVIRRENARPSRPLDRQFLAALGAGLPACAGVAVGFERLLMINQRTDDIADVVSFAFA